MRSGSQQFTYHTATYTAFHLQLVKISISFLAKTITSFQSAAQSKDFLTTYVVLPSGISGFCSKIEHSTDVNLLVAASICILMV